MKKAMAMTLCVILAFSMLLVGCSGKPATLKFGAGVYVTAPTATDATADKDGSGKVDVTVAAVSVEAVISSCSLISRTRQMSEIREMSG